MAYGRDFQHMAKIFYSYMILSTCWPYIVMDSVDHFFQGLKLETLSNTNLSYPIISYPVLSYPIYSPILKYYSLLYYPTISFNLLSNNAIVSSPLLFLRLQQFSKGIPAIQKLLNTSYKDKIYRVKCITMLLRVRNLRK